MDKSGTQLVKASDTSCCYASKAPVPQLQQQASGHSLEAPVAVLDPTVDTPRIKRLLPVPVVHDLSPPSLQSFLCTFLI